MIYHHHHHHPYYHHRVKALIVSIAADAATKWFHKECMFHLLPPSVLLLWLYMPFGPAALSFTAPAADPLFYDPQQLQRLLLYIYANDLVDRSSSEVAAVPLAGP